MMQVCRGKVWSRALAVTNGGYKRQLRRFGNRNETETKPKRNDQHLGWDAMSWPMYCAMVGGGVRGEIFES